MYQSTRFIILIIAAALAGPFILSSGCVSGQPPATNTITPPGEGLTFYTEQFPPYNYMENGTLKGMSVELLEATMEKTGTTVTPENVHLVSWTDAYQAVLTTNSTVLFSTGRIQEREDSFKWAGPIHTYSTVLFARPDRNIVIRSPEDLKGYRIGVIKDAVGAKQLIGIGMNESQLVIETNASVLIEKLDNGGIDLWAYPEPTGRYLTGQQTGNPYMFGVVYSLPPLELWYAFNQDVPDSTVQSFQEALDELKSEKDASGNTTYGQIVARYIL